MHPVQERKLISKVGKVIFRYTDDALRYGDDALRYGDDIAKGARNNFPEVARKGTNLDLKGDPRWPASEGWTKRAQNINGVEVHYQYNPKAGQIDDFKIPTR